jgi:putative copper export protein
MKIAIALIHLIFATTWLGTDFYFNFVVTPKLRTLEPSILGDVTTSLRRVTTPLLTVSAILTIVTGLVMMVQLHAKHPGPFSSTRWGTSLLIGAVFSLLVLALAVVDRPTSKKLGRLVESFKGRAATAEETVEMSRLSERSILAGRVATVLLLVALATMAVARYS